MLLYPQGPFQGIKSFNIKTMTQQSLTGLLMELKKIGAEGVYVLHDGTKSAEESFISARMTYPVLQKAMSFQRASHYNFTTTERSSEHPRLRASG